MLTATIAVLCVVAAAVVVPAVVVAAAVVAVVVVVAAAVVVVAVAVAAVPSWQQGESSAAVSTAPSAKHLASQGSATCHNN